MEGAFTRQTASECLWLITIIHDDSQDYRTRTSNNGLNSRLESNSVVVRNIFDLEITLALITLAHPIYLAPLLDKRMPIPRLRFHPASLRKTRSGIYYSASNSSRCRSVIMSARQAFIQLWSYCCHLPDLVRPSVSYRYPVPFH